MKLTIKKFNELTVYELYEILKLRQEVFGIEQNCLYQDMDDIDFETYHLFNQDDNNTIVSYCRVQSLNNNYKDAKIGRVIAKRKGIGLGAKIMNEATNYCLDILKSETIEIHAQVYAIRFYEKQGFNVTSNEYLIDDIPHVTMHYK